MAKKSSTFVYPTCVRHLKPRKDVRLRLFFLCKRCTESWKNEAFSGNAPLSTGEKMEGYCLLCNKLTSVQLQTWFLCDICDRVAKSIGRNHVAEQSILDYWEQTVKPKFPKYEIIQNDKASLRPRRAEDVSGEGPLDFLVKDKNTGKTIFGIENKTGRSSIKEMSQFQLDVSDCDSILHHVNHLHIPAYIIHAQVLELWKPPTMGFEAKGLWFTDMYKMAQNFTGIKMRALEQRGAAFFKRAAFSPIENFLEQLDNGDGTAVIVKQFELHGIPQIYRTN
ncbi:MAG: hypothetical protein A2X64_02905 [Ignavibacteria bacterium GWF2_33_9]|nr:MAG: hypothetical protein A2X64_02905 [Ignavibacteria bacterium GWF2_33_9]